MKNNFIKRKIIQLRVSFCNRKINRIIRKITKLNFRRESVTATRDRLVLAINNAYYSYGENRDFEKNKSSEISKIDFELCAIGDTVRYLTDKIDTERTKIVSFKRSL